MNNNKEPQLTEAQRQQKKEKQESREAKRRSAVEGLGELDTGTGSDTEWGRWMAQKNRWTTTGLGLALNVFANIYVFVVLLNSCGEDFCCPSAFSWNGWTPSETFQLLLGLMLIWIGMAGLWLLYFYGTNGFKKGLGGLGVVCGYIMVMGDLFLFMAYLSPSADDSCVSDAPFYFDVIGSFLPFVLVGTHAWWTISYTSLKDIGAEFQDTRTLLRSEKNDKKEMDEAVKMARSQRNAQLQDIVATGLVFKPFSALRAVMRPAADKHQHPL